MRRPPRKLAKVPAESSFHIAKRGEKKNGFATKDDLARLERMASVGYWETNADDTTEFWSEGFYRIHGLERSVKPSASRRLRLLHPGDRVRVEEAMAAAVRDRKGYSVEARILLPDKSWKWVVWLGEASGTGRDKTRFGIVKEIDPLKAEQVRRVEVQTRLDATESMAAVGSWEIGSDRKATYWSGEYARMHGIDPSSRPSMAAMIRMIYPKDRRLFRDAVDSAFLKGAPFSIEHRIVRADGEMRWVLSKGRIVAPGTDAQPRLLGVAADITDRKKAERDVEQRERRYRDLYNTTPVMMHSTSRDGTIIDVNDYWLKKLGYTREEVIGRDALSFYATDTQQRINRAQLATFLESGKVKNMKAGLLAKNGRRIEALISATTEYDHKGAYLKSMTVIVDVTEMRTLEDELKNLADLLTGLSNNIPDGFVFQYAHNSPSGRGTVSYVSGGCARVLGLKPEAVMQDPMQLTAMILPEDLRKVEAIVASRLRDLRRFELKFRVAMPDGTVKWLSSRAACRRQDPETVIVEGLVIDISNEKTLEQERVEALGTASETRQKLEAIANNLKDSVIFQMVADQNGAAESVPFVSKGSGSVFEVDDIEFMRDPGKFFQLVHPDDLAMIKEDMDQSRRLLQPVDIEYRIVTPGGKVKWNHTRAIPRRIDGGKTIWDGLTTNITTRKKLELAVMANEAKLQSIFDCMINGVVMVDINGEITYANQSAAEILFLEPEEVEHRYFASREWHQVDEDGNPLNPDELPLSIALRERRPVSNYEHGIVMQGEKVRWLNVSASPLIDSQQQLRGAVASFIDITSVRSSKRDLQRIHDELNAILNASTDATFFIGRDYRIRLFNKTAQLAVRKIFKRDIKVGDSMLEYPDLEVIDDFRRNFQRALSGEPLSVERELAFSSYPRIWCQITYLPVRNTVGEIIGISVNATDISARKNAEQALFHSKKYFESLVNSQSSFLIRTDLNGRYTFANDSFCERFGVDRDHLIGTDSLDSILPADHDSVRSTVLRCFAEPGKVVPVTLRKPRKDGGVYWTEWEFVAIQNETGELMGIQAVGLDATERVIAKMELVKANARLSMATKTANIGVWEWDLVTDETFYDEKLYEMIGVSSDVPMTYQKFREIIHPEDRELVDRLIAAALRDNSELDFVFRIIHNRTKEVRYFQVNGLTAHDEHGHAVRMIGVDHDITESYLAEKRLRESEELFKLAAQVAQIGVYDWNIVTNYTYFDETARKIFRMGDTPETEIFEAWFRGFRPEDLPAVKAAMDRTLAEGTPHDLTYRWISPAGEELFIHVTATPRMNSSGRIVAVTGVATDITSEKIAADRLRDSEERFRSLVRDINVGVLLLQPDEKLLLSNDAALDLLGRSHAQIEVHSVFSQIPDTAGDDANSPASWHNPIAMAIRSKSSVRGVIMSVVRPSHNDKRWLLVDAIPRLDRKGEVQDVICTLNDITQLKEAEQKLQLTRFTIEHSADSIFWIRPDASIADMNHAGLALLGYDYPELMHRKVTDLNLISAENWGSHWTQLRKSKSLKFDALLKRRNGSEVAVEVSTNFILFDRGEFSCAFVRDITYRKEFEQHLIASNREKDMLIREIHHRIKNNLQLISSILYIRSLSHREDGAIYEFFQSTREKIHAIALIHERLLQTGSVHGILTTDYLGDLINNIKITHSHGHETITIRTQISAFEMNLDKAIYCGLIINEVVTNSIKHAFTEREAGTIDVSLERDGRFCILSISDDGQGTGDPPDLTKSFGLRLLEIFIQQLQGSVRVDRTNGMAYHIEFPLDS